MVLDLAVNFERRTMAGTVELQLERRDNAATEPKKPRATKKTTEAAELKKPRTRKKAE